MVKTNLECIKQYPYSAAFGNIDLTPLAELPWIDISTQINESYILENHGADSVRQTIADSQARISIKTKNIEAGLALFSQFKPTMYINAPERRKEFILTPLCENEKKLIFPVAVLMPDMIYAPTFDRDHQLTLNFLAYPDKDGNLFMFM